MKLYYYIRFSENNIGGNLKFLAQINALEKLGIKSKCIFRTIEKSLIPGSLDIFQSNTEEILSARTRFEIINRFSVYRKLFFSLKEKCQVCNKDDIIYIRMFFPTRYLYKATTLKRNCKIILEHNTKEREEIFQLKKNYTRKCVFLLSDLLYSKKIRESVDAIVGVTPEITNYQLTHYSVKNKPSISISNGFEVNSVPVRTIQTLHDEIHLLMVANVSYWHGIDRILKGLKNYNGEMKIILHIAGNGNEIVNLKRISSELKLENDIVFHGFLTGHKLNELYNICHIGVGGLGIHRKKLSQTSELKAREYCARGLPYIIAVSDPDFPSTFPYIKLFPPDESPLNIEEIIEFAEIIYTDPHHAEKMRDYAIKNLDWSVKMKQLKTFIEEEVLTL